MQTYQHRPTAILAEQFDGTTIPAIVRREHGGYVEGADVEYGDEGIHSFFVGGQMVPTGTWIAIAPDDVWPDGTRGLRMIGDAEFAATYEASEA